MPESFSPSRTQTHQKQCKGHSGSRGWLAVWVPSLPRSERSWPFSHIPLVWSRVYEMSNHSIPTIATLRWTDLVCFTIVFQVPQQKSKSARHLTLGALSPLACRTSPRGPPLTFNSWEALHFATERRKGERREGNGIEQHLNSKLQEAFTWASEQKQKQLFVRWASHQGLTILTGTMQVS